MIFDHATVVTVDAERRIVRDGAIAVSGTRQSPGEEGVSYHRKERAEGPFSRSVTIPAAFDGSRVEAKYVDGILTLTLPKPEAAKPRRVTVQTS